MVLVDNLFLDFEIDIELSNSKEFNLLKEFLVNTFPDITNQMIANGIFDAYIQPKTIHYLEIEQEYREQKYPLTGVSELAYVDICFIIKNDFENISLKDMEVTL